MQLKDIVEANTASNTQKLEKATPFTRFDADLDIKYDTTASTLLEKDYWRVLTPFKFYNQEGDSKLWVHVPAGYLTDGASVPRPFWSIVPPWGSHGQASVVHDILCETLTMYDNGAPVLITRRYADQLFLEAMRAAGVSSFRRRLMYWCVRGWGMLNIKSNAARLAAKRAMESPWSQTRAPASVLMSTVG